MNDHLQEILAKLETAQIARTALAGIRDNETAVAGWRRITGEVLTPTDDWQAHTVLFAEAFKKWDRTNGPPPAWSPPPNQVHSNERTFCDRVGTQVEDLHRWTVQHREEFWKHVIETLGIVFREPPRRVLDVSAGAEKARWLPGSRLNIVESCFLAAPDDVAVVHADAGTPLRSVTYRELKKMSARAANGLRAMGVQPGDRVAIAMPMTLEAVVAYLATLMLGAAVVSIADSFVAEEIATRLRIAKCDLVVTQDVVHRAGKTLPMFDKVAAAGAARAIVVSARDDCVVSLRPGDVSWTELVNHGDEFEPVAADPDDAVNILFSSGTTGEPKAIPWTQTTPIKCAADGHLHHNITPGEVVAWPTNLGWMMGPWLIFASLLNRGTMGLFYGAPNTPDFCRFVEQAGVQMLGVVPSLVKAWRTGDMMRDCDWSHIDVFSSTGEASNSQDMLYLMSRARYRPVIEYCGGTEIGGGYVCGSVNRPHPPSTFSTPAYGLDLRILDEDGRDTNDGEVFLVPPSIGLSATLLNRDHHEVYYADTPDVGGTVLRRHGDQVEAIEGGFFRALGRADDTMNLGGIKISSAEIERTINSAEVVNESAAIAFDPPGGGPSLLVVYAVLNGEASPETLKPMLQKTISAQLNPLFRIHDVVVLDSLPRTASNKVMRRVLRANYKPPAA